MPSVPIAQPVPSPPRGLLLSLLLGLTTLLAVASSAVAQSKPQLRAEYFYRQRAFPFDRVQPGAMAAARRQAFSRFGSLLRSGSATSASAWSPMGPQRIMPVFESYIATGRLTAIAVHPTDSNTIYVGGAQGGVWKTSNGGASWTALTDKECSLANGHIVIDPADPSTVYVGTGELNEGAGTGGYYGCGVLKSTDGGSTWSQVGASTFDPPGKEGARISRVAIVGTSLLVTSNFGLHRSTDGGATWVQQAGGRWTDMVVDPTDTNVVWAAVRGQGIFKSTDGGTGYNETTNGLPAGTETDRINLAISASSPNTVYAAIVDPNDTAELLGLYRTTDGGGTWAKTATTPECGQCFYDLALAVHPTDANTVLFGGVAMFRSTDGGATFQEIVSGDGDPIHVDQHYLTFDPQDPNTVYVGNDGGIYKSTDSGTTWSTLNTNLALTQFYPGISPNPTDANSAIGGTQDNGSLRTDGSTQDWREIACGDGGYTAWDRNDPTTIYLTCQAGTDGPMRSTNDAVSFTLANNGIDLNEPTLFIPPLIMDPTDTKTLYFGTNRVYKTTDGADTWTAISGDLTFGLEISTIAPAPSDPTTVYVGTSDGNVLVATAGGAFQPIVDGLPERFVTDFAVHPTDASHVYITYSGFGSGHVFRSTNRGQSWQDISGNLPDMPVNTVLLEPGDASTIYLGTDLGVYVSANGGGSWSPFNEGLPLVGVLDLAANASTGVMLAGTHGRGMFRSSISVTGTAVALSVAPASRSASSEAGSMDALPDSASVTITGTGAESTAWTATHGAGSWLTVTTTGGTGSGQVHWSRDPAGLSAGTYVDTITVTAPGATGSPARVVDTLTITVPATLALEPSSRRAPAVAGFTGSIGDSATVTLSGGNASAVPWTASHGAGAWLTVGTETGTGSGVVRWSRDPTGLAAGVYVDTITVTASGATGSPALVVDTLEVAQAIALDAAADQLILGGSSLTALQMSILDELGNNDGTFNLGDVLGWLDRCTSANPGGCISSSAAVERVSNLRGGQDPPREPGAAGQARGPS